MHLLDLHYLAAPQRRKELGVAHVTRRESVEKAGTFEQWGAKDGHEGA
jgi:hypothetical protein